MTFEASAVGSAEPSGEHDVIAQLQAGQLEAVGEMYDRHHEAVRRFARRLVGDAAEAEDLVQEVFVRLPKIAKNYRGASSFRSFLIGVAARLSSHHVRAAARRRKLHERSGSDDETGRISDRPDALRERRELADILSRALDTLSLEQRVAFVLFEVEHHTSSEIGVLVGAPEGTVRTRIMYAKKNLRAYLSREGLP